VVGAITGGLTAVVGRAVTRSDAVPVPVPPSPQTPSPRPSKTRHRPQRPAPSGRVIAHVNDVSPGSAHTFVTSAGGPGVLVREPDGSFRAFSAVCTHAGCTVGYSPDAGLVCPCHGGRFDPQTGAVVAGPPPSPLTSIAVHVSDGDVRID
jgi:Rieske Fe-S protein